MNVRSDDGYGDQMMTHQQTPTAQADICGLREPGTANEPLRSVQGLLYRSNAVLLEGEVMVVILPSCRCNQWF